MFTRFGQVTSLTAAALAAAAVLAACSPGTGIGVETTAGTATPSPGLRDPSTVPSSEQPEKYIDVTGDENDVRFDLSNPPRQFGSPAPGVRIGRFADGPTGQASCTLGPAVEAGPRHGFITAGHCAGKKLGAVHYAQIHADGSSPLPLGPTEEFQDQPADSGWSDSAIIWTEEARGDSTLAGAWEVDRAMSVDEVRDLAPATTPICVDGAVAGVRCSPLVDADKGLIRFERITSAGDSGAPVFVVTETGDAVLIGIVQGLDKYDPDLSVATFLAPALTRLKVDPVTAHSR